MGTDASFAVANEPPWSPWRGTALLMDAEAILLVGDRDRAAELFEETCSASGTLDNADNIALSKSELAVLAMDGGRWAEASQYLEYALSLIEDLRLDDYAVSVLTFAAAARLALHRGDHQEVTRQLARAMRARQFCTFVLPWLAVRARLQLAKVYAAIGDQASTHHLLREIDGILLHRPAMGTLVDEVSELRGVLTSSADVNMAGPTPLSPAELRLLPYLQTHLTFREIGNRLFVSRNTVSSEVGSIYRKLGVSSRSDAVQHATTVGLLGG